MFITLIVVHVIVAVSLVLIVLLQTGRGAELGAAFGGMGQATYGRGQYTFVHKVTTALAIIFMVTSLSLAFIEIEQPRSSILAPADTAADRGPSSAQPPAPAAADTGTAQEEQPSAATPTLPQQDAPPAGGRSQ